MIVKSMLAKSITIEEFKELHFIDWHISEKLDGVRCHIYLEDGEVVLQARPNGGTKKVGYYKPSERFLKVFKQPKLWESLHEKNYVGFDGELYIDRGCFEKTVSVVKKKEPIAEEWNKVIFVAYDLLPKVNNNLHFTTRQFHLENIVDNFSKLGEHLVSLAQSNLDEIDAAETFLSKVLSMGGEGVILKHKFKPYEYGKRSDWMLKIKPIDYDFAQVVGYQPGKGKYEGCLGALIVDWDHDGEAFDFEIGTGLTDYERVNYEQAYPIGKTVMFSHLGLTKKGCPRNAALIQGRKGGDPNG